MKVIISVFVAVCLIGFVGVRSAEPPSYKIITSQYPEDVEREVFSALVDGYELHGNLVVGNNKFGDLVFIQVVTK